MKNGLWKNKAGVEGIVCHCAVLVAVAVLVLMMFGGSARAVEFHKIPDSAVARTLDGKTVSLADYRGKLVFLVMWRTDCPACIGEIPILKKLETEHGGDDFAVIGVSVDRGKDELVAKAIDIYRINYPVWLAYDQPLLQYTNTPIFPTLFVIGPNGEALGYIPGAFTSYAEAEDVLKQSRAFVEEHKLAE